MSYLRIKLKNILTNKEEIGQFLHFGDAIKFIKEFPSNSVKFLSVDPPFNMWCDLVANGFIEELQRVLHPDGNLLIWYNPTVSMDEEIALKTKLKYLNMIHDEITWINNMKGNKLRGDYHTLNYIGAKIIWAVKNKNEHDNKTMCFNRYCGPYIYKGKKTESWSMVNGKPYLLNKRIGGEFNRACLKNIYSFNVDPKINPTYKKPDELLEIFYRAFVIDGNVTIVDLFGGSGGFIKYAKKSNNTCFTAEIDQERCIKMIETYDYLKMI